MALVLRNTQKRWGALAQVLHWLVVWAVITQFVLAEVAAGLPDGLAKLATLAQHKSVGITILALALLRLAWRRVNRGRSPVLPADLRPWEKPLAHLTHHGLYLLLVVVPLTGWMMSSAKNYPVSWFNLLGPLPDLVPPNQSLYDWLEAAHGYSALAMQWLAIVHALAALFHHFIRRDDVLSRMLPFAGKPVERGLMLVVMAAGGSVATQALLPAPAAQTPAAVAAPSSPMAPREVPAFMGVTVVESPSAGTPVAAPSAPAAAAAPARAAAVAAPAVVVPAAPPAPAWQLDATNSSLGFEFVQAGAPTTGRFRQFTADLLFAPGKAPAGQFDVRIQTGTADTQDKDRDQTLASDALFASGRLPEARYLARRFAATADGYRAEGELTLKGITRPVPLSFRFSTAADGSARLEGSATLQRLAFNVGEGEWKSTEWIGDEVTVRFALRLVPRR
ncbi:MAG: hypothetical protein RL026_788 [Pseudomonadota bacterium]|jgi:cytochrome b561/polyisoprenoid-binding protein YceI